MRTAIPPIRYTIAIKGTTFSVTAARRDKPPRKMKPANTTMIMPISQVGMPNAVFIVDAMEFD